MKKTHIASIVVVFACALPMAASAQQRLTEEQLIQRANDNGVCGERTAVAASYVDDTSNSVSVRCGDDVEGFVPLVGVGLGAGAGAAAAAAALALGAAAAGGGGSTPDTQ